MDPSDKLTIETPEQTVLEFSLAGVGSRFLALAVDTLIQFVAALVLLVAGMIGVVFNLIIWPSGWSWTAAILLILLFLLYHGYFAFFEAIWNGQTPGKRYVRLRVIKESGRPITVYDAITRNLLRIVDQLPGMYAIAIVSVLLSRQNKRLGDYAAGTVVVRESPFEEMQPGWDLTEAEPSHVYGAAQLSFEEFQLIETFLSRRGQLSEEVRHEAADQIAKRIGEKLGIPQSERPSAEAFLEGVVREFRAMARYR